MGGAHPSRWRSQLALSLSVYCCMLCFDGSCCSCCASALQWTDAGEHDEVLHCGSAAHSRGGERESWTHHHHALQGEWSRNTAGTGLRVWEYHSVLHSRGGEGESRAHHHHALQGEWFRNTAHTGLRVWEYHYVLHSRGGEGESWAHHHQHAVQGEWCRNTAHTGLRVWEYHSALMMQHTAGEVRVRAEVWMPIPRFNIQTYGKCSWSPVNLYWLKLRLLKLELGWILYCQNEVLTKWRKLSELPVSLKCERHIKYILE